MTMVSSYIYLLQLLLFSLLVARPVSSETTSSPPTTSTCFCDVGGTYTNNTSFHTNLNLLLASLLATAPTAATRASYDTRGQAPTRIVGLASCFGCEDGEEGATSCMACLTRAMNDVFHRCANRKQAIIVSDKCLLTYTIESLEDRSQDEKSAVELSQYASPPSVEEASSHPQVVEERLIPPVVEERSELELEEIPQSEQIFESESTVYETLVEVQENSTENVSLEIQETVSSSVSTLEVPSLAIDEIQESATEELIPKKEEIIPQPSPSLSPEGDISEESSELDIEDEILSPVVIVESTSEETPPAPEAVPEQEPTPEQEQEQEPTPEQEQEQEQEQEPTPTPEPEIKELALAPAPEQEQEPTPAPVPELAPAQPLSVPPETTMKPPSEQVPVREGETSPPPVTLTPVAPRDSCREKTETEGILWWIFLIISIILSTLVMPYIVYTSVLRDQSHTRLDLLNEREVDTRWTTKNNFKKGARMRPRREY